MSSVILPANFEDFSSLEMEGFTISQKVLDAKLKFRPCEKGYSAVLVGVLNTRSGGREIIAESRNHNWVLDESTIRPLPKDISDCIKEIAGN